MTNWKKVNERVKAFEKDADNGVKEIERVTAYGRDFIPSTNGSVAILIVKGEISGCYPVTARFVATEFDYDVKNVVNKPFPSKGVWFTLDGYYGNDTVAKDDIVKVIMPAAVKDGYNKTCYDIVRQAVEAEEGGEQ